MSANSHPEAMSSVTIPIGDDRYVRKQIFPLRQFQRIPIGVVVVVVGLFVFFVQGYRLSAAPDIFSDEGIYLLAGANVAKGLGLELNGAVFMWHPPAYMLAEAIYIKLAGLTNADPLTTLLSVRYLNVFFSAITAMLLFLICNRLHSKKAGLITVALFLMDPYVQRINRRGMLETLAMLCTLLALYLFFMLPPSLTKRRRLGAGVAFGLAVLTKEPMFMELLTLIIYVLLFKRSQIRDVISVIVIACVTYAIYPLWTIVTGQGYTYVSFKLFGILRIINLLEGHRKIPTYHTSTVNYLSTANVSFLGVILLRLTQYGTSYLLIVLSALCLVFLVLKLRHTVAAPCLISWGLLSFVFSLALGFISDQYFYYLIVPSTLMVGYSTTLLIEATLHPSTQQKVLLIGQQRRIFLPNFTFYRGIGKSVFILFIVFFAYNSYIWLITYVTGYDNLYTNAIKYVEEHVPRGEMVEASDDVAVYYLYPAYAIRLDRDPQTIVNLHVHYFILSSKDALNGYNGMTPSLYNWVKLHSRPLQEGHDLSFSQIGIYQLTT